MHNSSSISKYSARADADVLITPFHLAHLCHHRAALSLSSYCSQSLPVRGSFLYPWSKSLYGTERQEFWVLLTLVLLLPFHDLLQFRLNNLPSHFWERKILLTSPPLARAPEMKDTKLGFVRTDSQTHILWEVAPSGLGCILPLSQEKAMWRWGHAYNCFLLRCCWNTAPRLHIYIGFLENIHLLYLCIPPLRCRSVTKWRRSGLRIKARVSICRDLELKIR